MKVDAHDEGHFAGSSEGWFCSLAWAGTAGREGDRAFLWWEREHQWAREEGISNMKSDVAVGVRSDQPDPLSTLLPRDISGSKESSTDTGSKVCPGKFCPSGALNNRQMFAERVLWKSDQS